MSQKIKENHFFTRITYFHGKSRFNDTLFKNQTKIKKGVIVKISIVLAILFGSVISFASIIPVKVVSAKYVKSTNTISATLEHPTSCDGIREFQINFEDLCHGDGDGAPMHQNGLVVMEAEKICSGLAVSAVELSLSEANCGNPQTISILKDADTGPYEDEYFTFLID